MQKENYDLYMEREIASFGSGIKPRLLLHVCCAPCASSVLFRIAPYFKITLYYYNPNTYPYEEYVKRGSMLPILLHESGLENDIDVIYCDYDSDSFYASAKSFENEPEGGARCLKCFDLRLRSTALAAKDGAYDYFATTLTVSPHKNAEIINTIGAKIAEETGVKWLPSDFKKKNGYLLSTKLSQEYGLYRQNYCGCAFSKGTE